HESVVHGLLSLTVGAVPGLQALAAAVPSHVSSPLHLSPSAHDAPAASATCWTPSVASHESVVHGLLSLTVGAVPALQALAAAVPSHGSSPLHLSPSAHDAPAASATCCTPRVASHESVVHGLLSLTVGAVPALQALAVAVPSHVSSPLHLSPSAHDAP